MSDIEKPKGPEQDEPIDLEEVRAARALAEALEGKGDPKGETLDLLANAARIAAGRTPELRAEAKARIASELFPAPRRVSRLLAIAAGITLIAGAGLAWRLQQPAEVKVAGALRDDARVLVASLLPAGDTPGGRATAIAEEARRRVRAAREGGGR